MWSIVYPRLDFILSKPIYFFYKQVMTLTRVFLCSYNWSWPVKWLPQAVGHCDFCSHKAHPAVLLEFQGPPWARSWHRALPVWATGGSGPQTSGQCHGQSEYQGGRGKSVWLLMSFESDGNLFQEGITKSKHNDLWLFIRLFAKKENVSVVWSQQEHSQKLHIFRQIW